MSNTTAFLLTALMLLSCTPDKPDDGKKEEEQKDDVGALYTVCDFDKVSPEVKAVNCSFSVADNPLVSEANRSQKCGKVKLKGGTWDCVMIAPTHPLDFTKSGPVIRFKVLAPAANAPVYIKLDLASSAEGAPEPLMKSVNTVGGGDWEELTFNLSDLDPQSNWYGKLYLMFEGGVKVPDEEWYFDDVLIPDDDISSLSLFKREATNFAPRPDKGYAWISNSTANPAVLTPDKSPDGNWWLFMRGGDGKRAHLGIYTQKASTFNPHGPWIYYSGNPVVPAGWYGWEDSYHAIDPVPVVGKDKKVYLYYKGISDDKKNTVLLALSDDGFNYTRAQRHWKDDCGVADVVEKDGKYYLFVSRRVYEYTDMLSGDGALMVETLQKGGGPSNCDRYSINGQKILHIDGVDKWFMIYQCSPCNSDFPDRFHVAVSDDLLHWTKVDNDQPLFTRGPRGSWDQGAIWAPSTFEYEGKLYMYYEGWGTEGPVSNRDKQYFTPAHSCIGIASCNVEDFLKWCGLK